MVALPATVVERPESKLQSLSIDDIRSGMLRRIGAASLTPAQRRSALAELDYHLQFERLRRIRSTLWQWHDEKRERVRRRIVEREELARRLTLDRANARTELMELRARRVNARLDVIERIQKVAPRDDSHSLMLKARKEALRQRVARRLARSNRRHFEEELSDMIVARGRFLRRVREEFPEIEDELMDKYDAQLYQKGMR